MFPKKGKVFPRSNSDCCGSFDYADAIASALRKELGDSHQAVKTAMRWTGARERTVKNWLAGSNGPSGHHLVALVQHSEEVFGTLLRLSGRPPSIDLDRLVAAHEALANVLKALDVAAEQKAAHNKAA
jgi:hypothetical protein